MPAKRLKRRIRLGIAARMRILDASEALETQNSLGDRSENTNLGFQRSARNVEFAWGSQRECEFRMPAKRLKRRIRLGIAARMRILSARTQNSLQDRRRTPGDPQQRQGDPGGPQKVPAEQEHPDGSRSAQEAAEEAQDTPRRPPAEPTSLEIPKKLRK